jgi:hypothetical protein
MCCVSPRSTSEQRAHYLVHQLDSKNKLRKHTTHHPLINVLQKWGAAKIVVIYWRSAANCGKAKCGELAIICGARVHVQWASQKKRISYDFNFYVGSTRHIPKSFRSAALSTATQPWWSADRPSQRRHGFISLRLGNLKRLIAPNTSIAVIRPIRLPGSHHGEAPELIFDFH